MNLAAFVSGGKDSLFALYLAKKAGNKIEALVVMESSNPESYMFHYPNVHLVKEQAKLMGIKLIKQKTKGEKEKELEDIKKVLNKMKNIDGIVTGAVASSYQKSRIDAVCKELGLKSLAPLWNQNPEKTVREMLSNNFEIIITAVAAPPLDEKWLGRRFDEKCLEDLIKLNIKYGIHLNGEGGEFETFVTGCPMFSKKIIIKDAEKWWDARTKSGMLKINKIMLMDKKINKN